MSQNKKSKLITDATLTLVGEPTFLSLSSPPIACLAIADSAKLNCRRPVIGFERNSCMGLVKCPDILRNAEEWKRSERSRNGYLKIYFLESRMKILSVP